MRKTVIAVAALAAVLSGSVAAQATPAYRSHTVVYEVWADQSSTASTVTYFGSDNSIDQVTDVALPWSLRVVNDSTYPSFVMNAQNDGTGAISCRITVDGVVKDTETAHGRYSVVDCSTS